MHVISMSRFGEFLFSKARQNWISRKSDNHIFHIYFQEKQNLQLFTTN